MAKKIKAVPVEDEATASKSNPHIGSTLDSLFEELHEPIPSETETSSYRESDTQPVAKTPDEEAKDEEAAAAEELELSTLTVQAREERRLAKKPKINHLKSGVLTDPETGDKLPVFDIGDRIIVERCSMLLSGSPWLDTRLYEVRWIDDESGAVHCCDPEFMHHAVISFKSPFHRIVIPPVRGNPFAVPRGRSAQTPGEGLPVAIGTPAKRGRGRPKGSKNRAKDVIKAEKAERQSQKNSSKRRRRVIK